MRRGLNSTLPGEGRGIRGGKDTIWTGQNGGKVTTYIFPKSLIAFRPTCYYFSLSCLIGLPIPDIFGCSSYTCYIWDEIHKNMTLILCAVVGFFAGYGFAAFIIDIIEISQPSND